ncbi:MAG: DUF3301 domain-containing protein [Gammaproteobacteria bacterium]|nr:DUF3301 domain-containing protein [Gammaproteobacteria bacterium]
MSWEILLTAVLLAILGAFWHSSLAARELANRVALDTCTSAQVQMLDGTVSIHSLKLVRHTDAPVAWRRTYVFDYTEDGFSRRRGFVVLTGATVDTVGLEPRAA